MFKFEKQYSLFGSVTNHPVTSETFDDGFQVYRFSFILGGHKPKRVEIIAPAMGVINVMVICLLD